MWILPLLVLALGAVWLFARRKRSAEAAMVRNEVWVYTSEEKFPRMDVVMAQCVAPRDGTFPLVAAEARIFSDVRLWVELVKRAKNPFLFRPDLFSEAEADRALLSALAKAEALVRVRFLRSPSEPGIGEHVSVPRIAAQIARGPEVLAVYDAVAERLISADEARGQAMDRARAESAEQQVRLVRIDETGAVRFETRGLAKRYGVEWSVDAAPSDHATLLSGVLQEALERAWAGEGYQDGMAVTLFDDLFRLNFRPLEPGKVGVSVVRESGQ